MWKRLTHPNIVPLLGITLTPLQFISAWMPGGELKEYIIDHPDMDRLNLVGPPSVASKYAYPLFSYLVSPVVSITSTPATWSMGTSRVCVIVRMPVLRSC